MDYLFFFNHLAVDGNYTEWGSWGTCSKTCGGGFKVRVRNCTNPEPQFGGKDCTRLGPPQMTQECGLTRCARK